MSEVDEFESLIGVRFDDEGNIIREDHHRSGEVEKKALADPQPDTAPHQHTDALTGPHRAGLSRSERVQLSCAVEAALLKIFTSVTDHGRLSDSACRAAMMEVCRAADKAEYIGRLV